jgi:hypothetical protein
MNQSKHFAADLSDDRADVQAARRVGTATRHGAEYLSTDAAANDACNTVTSDRPRGVEDDSRARIMACRAQVSSCQISNASNRIASVDASSQHDCSTIGFVGARDIA